MEQRRILVLQKRVRCFSCGTEFEGFAEAPDEGFGYAHKLYECENCHTVFAHSIEDEQYLGSVAARVKTLRCPVCRKLLEETLRKKEFVGVCPTCGRCDYAGTDQGEEASIASFQLYS
jgi:phage FluMu protein Com